MWIAGLAVAQWARPLAPRFSSSAQRADTVLARGKRREAPRRPGSSGPSQRHAESVRQGGACATLSALMWRWDFSTQRGVRAFAGATERPCTGLDCLSPLGCEADRKSASCCSRLPTRPWSLLARSRWLRCHEAGSTYILYPASCTLPSPDTVRPYWIWPNEFGATTK